MSRSSDASSFIDRYGDAAEKTFLAFAKHHGIHVERYGFDRTPLPRFHTLPPFIRSTPDYVATKNGKETGFLVECKAGGNGNVVNIKQSDFTQMSAWNTLADLYLFFNDSKRKRVAFVSFDKIDHVFAEYPDDITEGVWPSDNVRFYAVPKRFFDWIAYNEFQ